MTKGKTKMVVDTSKPTPKRKPSTDLAPGSTISSRSTRSRSAIVAPTEHVPEITSKKLVPKTLNFASVSAERLAEIGDKGAFESIISKYIVSFGVDSEGRPREPPRIPLCRLMTMESVRTLQQQSVQKMKIDFERNGYVPKLSEFHITEVDDHGTMFPVSEFESSWGPIWTKANADFEAECDTVEEFKVLKGKMFWVFDGNHRLNAWSAVANANPNIPKYHVRVRFSVVDPGADGFKKIEQAMHALNA